MKEVNKMNEAKKKAKLFIICFFLIKFKCWNMVRVLGLSILNVLNKV